MKKISHAEKMRNKSESIRKKKNDGINKENNIIQKEINEEAEKLYTQFLSEALEEIDEKSDTGTFSCYIGYTKYGWASDEPRKIAYEKVVKTLESKEYNYVVEKLPIREGFSGEGNNSSDFYYEFYWRVKW